MYVVNDFDLTGTIGWKKWFGDRGRNAVSIRNRVGDYANKHPRQYDLFMILATRGRGGTGKNGMKGDLLGIQTKRISAGEIGILKKNGYDIHALKGGKNASARDIFKDKKGNLFVNNKKGTGIGEPLGINIKHLSSSSGGGKW
ncbi:MAG TPA: polymorphic toxin type 33 domain-containing protein [Nevskiaceae bacterium]|nr:polymorphic toxin type 33 domain-containing protein [Nevskiaceae bacterium]